MNEDGTFTHRWEYTAPERPLSKTWYALSGSITVESADAFKRLADALKGVFDTLRKASHLLRLLQSPRQRKYARERVRCEHAYKRQAAAIVAKMAAETMLLNTDGLDVRIIRPFNVAGPRQREEGGFVLPRFIRQAKAGEPLTVYTPGTQRRAFTHVLDIVDGVKVGDRLINPR